MPQTAGCLFLTPLSPWSLAGDYAKVKLAARAAYEATDSPTIKAQCLALLARAHHAEGRYNEAVAYYSRATEIDKNLPIAHLGTAQMFLHQNIIVNAATELEKVLEVSKIPKTI